MPSQNGIMIQQQSTAPTLGDTVGTEGWFLGHGDGFQVQNLDLAFKSRLLPLDSGHRE
jgi:hypothetical protein